MTDHINKPVLSPVDKKSKMAAGISIIGFSLFIIIMLAFHFIQPELNPLTRFGSEYVVGRLGWIMNIAFFCFAGGLLSLAFAFNRGLNPQNRSMTGLILFVLAAIGILGAGLFNTHLQGEQPTTAGIIHALSSFLAFLTIIPAMFIFSRQLRLADLLKGKYKALRYLPWVITLFFLSMIFVFGELNLIGLGQRLFLFALFYWLFLASRGFQTGAFVSGKDLHELYS